MSIFPSKNPCSKHNVRVHFSFSQTMRFCPSQNLNFLTICFFSIKNYSSETQHVPFVKSNIYTYIYNFFLLKRTKSHQLKLHENPKERERAMTIVSAHMQRLKRKRVKADQERNRPSQPRTPTLAFRNGRREGHPFSIGRGFRFLVLILAQVIAFADNKL